MNSHRNVSDLVASLVTSDPSDPSVVKLSSRLAAVLAGTESTAVDPDMLLSEVQKLHQAAVIPANNYSKIASITSGLARAVEISRRPQNAELRSKIATIVAKLAGIFAECDTADELSAHTLEEIESAVHKLYSNGALNKPSTYNFEARGKGHHGK